MRNSSPARIVMLTAPAGYSKTTCLRDWNAADPRPFAMIRCTSRHDDPAVLVESITTELDQFLSIDVDVTDALSSLKPDIDVVLDRLGRSLAKAQGPFVLVLDDLHAMTSPAALALMRGLIDVLPQEAQLAIASRSEPRLPLGRMRTNGSLLEIGTADLAMTRAEGRALLTDLGVELKPAELEALHERTEGWPGALHLAGITLGAQPDSAAAIAAFAGDDRIVADYLRDEFLSALRPSERRFLIRASALDELSGPICNAALNRSGSAQLLHALSRASSLIVPLDRKDERYRLHHLLAEMLISELRRREPEVETEIHDRASRWYAEHGELDNAIDHAIAAGDTERAGELVWRAFPEVSGSGRVATLDRWLDALGQDEVASCIPLALVTAHRDLAVGAGESAAHWARVAKAAAADRPEARHRADLYVLDATMPAGGVVAMGEAAGRAAELLAPEDPWQSACSLYRGVSAYLTGQPDRARPLLRDAARRGAVVSPIIQALALAELCQIAAGEGRWEEGYRLIDQASQRLRSSNLTEFPAMTFVHSGAALVHANNGRIDRAREDLRRSRTLVDRLSDFPAWYEVQVRIQMSQGCVRLDDLAAARSELHIAERLNAVIPDAPTVVQLLEQTKGMLVAAAQGRRDCPLTDAELRTLQYLPSHLPLSRIAEHMFVSVNTVKSHTRSTYRKLDVSSRAEAVERARELGLLREIAGGSSAPPAPRLTA